MKFFPSQIIFAVRPGCESIIISPGTMRNVDKRGYNLVQDLLAGKHELLRQGIV
ncbi:MAG TPA: hypothetical protein VGM65_07720 [Candidatus Udaeobacter sp.]